MTSNELKHEAKKQEWSMSIQECRGSGLSVSEWCRQRGVTTATYYRWERELLTGVRKNGAPPSTAVAHEKYFYHLSKPLEFTDFP